MGLASIIDYSGEKRVVLNGNALVQAFPVGFSWRKLRIGLRLAMPNAVTLGTNPPKLRIGLASNPLAIPFVDPDYENGYVTYIEPQLHSLQAALSVVMISSSNGSCKHVTKFNNVQLSSVDNDAGTATPSFGISRTAGTPWIIEFTKNIDATVTPKLWAGEHDETAAHDGTFGDTHIKDALLSPDPLTFLTLNIFRLRNFTANTAIDEATYGNLSYLFISYDNTPYPLHLCSIGVAKLE